MSLAGRQINLIDVNFHFQKSVEIFDRNSADKIWSKKYKEIKVSPLMPIRVKPQIMSYPAPSTELDKKVLDPHVTPTTNLQNDQDFKD